MRVLRYFLVISTLVSTGFAAKPVFDTFPKPGVTYPSLHEGASIGTFYYQFTATELSSLKITYSLDSTIAEWLQINQDNGNTTVKKVIDKVAELQVFLTVHDINNHPPIMINIPKTVNINEDSAIGSTLSTVNIDDKDEGVNKQTNLHINSGNEAGKFRITNEKIILNTSLDYDHGVRQYVLNITARNSEPPHLETSGILTINVVNVDDLGLEFTKKLYTGKVINGSAMGTPILRVEAKDLDGLNETITYAILPETNPGDLDAINSNTGEVLVNGQLEIGIWTLVITAISRKHGSYITIVRLQIVSSAFQAHVETIERPCINEIGNTMS